MVPRSSILESVTRGWQTTARGYYKTARKTGERHRKQGDPCALDSLWRGTISSFWQPDRKCLQEATSPTNVHTTQFRKKPGHSGMQAMKLTG